MEKHTVAFQPGNRTVRVEAGTTLADAARTAGLLINNLCGGAGVCGRCRVRLLAGRAEAEAQARALFSKEELAQGYLLACQTEVHEDLEILIPPESGAEETRIMTGGAEGEVPGRELKPLVRKLYLEPALPTLEDNIADIDRISRELRKRLGWHSFEIGLTCLQHLSDRLRDNDWKVTASVVRCRNGYRIQKIEPNDTSSRNYGVAVDVGTTTVVVQLVDLNGGTVLGSEGSLNRQASFGEDVISRMIYACGKGGVHPLHEAVIGNLNELIQRVAEQNRIPLDDISAVVAAGNTTMSHFLLGLTPCSIRLDPYVPTADVYPQVLAREIGLEINPTCILETVPGVASYVGGDIVAGVLSCGIPDREEATGLIDIGTNGEIAIGNRDWLVCCSASAGPAFEGGGTRCGMRATRGAIEKIELRPDRVSYRTIGNAAPLGICGSGLIDAIYELVKNGIIGADGKFDRSRSDGRLGIEDGVPYYAIASAGESDTGEAIVITESDIANLIKSKGAVFAAIKSLMDYIGLHLDQIATFYVAGGFGSYLDIPKAVAIGLLPDIPREKIRFIGNSSLTGARMALLSEEAFERTIHISRSMSNIELSNHQPFMEEYIAALFLPHTDRRLFPSVAY